jgi:hypothetical protein
MEQNGRKSRAGLEKKDTNTLHQLINELVIDTTDEFGGTTRKKQPKKKKQAFSPEVPDDIKLTINSVDTFTESNGS